MGLADDLVRNADVITCDVQLDDGDDGFVDLGNGDQLILVGVTTPTATPSWLVVG